MQPLMAQPKKGFSLVSQLGLLPCGPSGQVKSLLQDSQLVLVAVQPLRLVVTFLPR